MSGQEIRVALDELARETHGLVDLAKKGPRPGDAADIAQHVSCNLLRIADSGKALDIKDFRAYVRKALRNRALDLINQEQRDPTVSVEDLDTDQQLEPQAHDLRAPPSDPLDVVQWEQEKQIFLASIADLSDQERAVIKMLLDQCTNKQMAEQLQLTVDRFRGLRQRTQAKLCQAWRSRQQHSAGSDNDVD